MPVEFHGHIAFCLQCKTEVKNRRHGMQTPIKQLAVDQTIHSIVLTTIFRNFK